MRAKNTIILFIIAAAAAGYFFLVEQPRHERETARVAGQNALTPLVTAEITGLSIHRPDLTLDFERQGDTWRMLLPVPDTADRGAVNTLLEQITTADVAARFSADRSALGRYGLDDPAADILLQTAADDSALTLSIGDSNPAKTGCYARRGAGGDVLMLPIGIRRSAVLAAFEYRDKRIFDEPVATVARIDIVSADRTMSWRRGDTGEWITVLHGDTTTGDPTPIDNIVRELRGLRAKDIPFPPGDPGAYFTDTTRTITLWANATGGPVTLVFGGTRDGGTCYVRSSQSGRVALVDSTVLHIFAYTINDLRDRRLLEFNRDEVARITLSTPEGELSIIRSESGWSFANPQFGNVSDKTAAALLGRLERIAYAEVIEDTLEHPERFGFDAPGYRLMIFDDRGRVIDAVEAGDALPGGGRYVTSRSTRVVGRIDDAEWESLVGDFRSLGG